MRLVILSQADPAWTDFRSALIDAGLPVEDLTDDGQCFFTDEAGVFGGLALRGSHAMLRSLVAPRSARGQGKGRRMVEALCREAARRGAAEAWLLTTDAADFFRACGFDRASRADAPEPIRQTRQFSSMCPAGAALMRRALLA